MRTKLMLTTLLLILLMGCSKDDKDEPENPHVETDQLIQSIFLNGDGYAVAYHFLYNEDHTIKKIKSTEDWILEYSYQDDLISTIEATENNVEIVVFFEYDTQKKLKSYTIEGLTVPVEYLAEDNSYNYEISQSGKNFIVKEILNNEGDVTQYKETNIVTQEVENYEYDYYSSKKGSGYYTNNVFAQSSIASSSFKRLPTLGQFTKRPLTSTSGSIIIFYDNSFDENNYISESNLIGNGFRFTLRNNYISL